MSGKLYLFPEFGPDEELIERKAQALLTYLRGKKDEDFIDSVSQVVNLKAKTLTEKEMSAAFAVVRNYFGPCAIEDILSRV